MRKLTGVPLLLLVTSGLALVISAGCASSSSTSAAYSQMAPAPYQPGPVEMTTEEGHDILHSEKRGSRVAVSLRNATEDYLQFFVSARNTGDDPRRVSPSNMRLRFESGDKRMVRMHPASSVPNLIAREDRSSALAAAELMRATGQLYASEERTSGSEGNPAYGGGSESDGGQELLLQPSWLLKNRRVTGFVYGPAPSAQAGQFVIEVPVGDEVHRFRYTFR